MKEKKLDALKKSHDDGFITKEEYEREKKNIEEMHEEGDLHKEEQHQEIKEAPLRSDKLLIIAVILILIGFGIFFGMKYFTKAEQPKTIDDLHALNFKGKLKEDQGFLYKGVYSFVKFEDLWYTQLVSPKGSRLYNIQFRYNPKEVESIETIGQLNLDFFNNASEYYVTFTPHEGNNFSGMVVAIADFNQQMSTIFFKQPIPAC